MRSEESCQVALVDQDGRRPVRAICSSAPRSPLARCASAESAETRSSRARTTGISESSSRTVEESGAPGEARTLNHQIRSLLLYPLSYGGVSRIIHERHAGPSAMHCTVE